MECERRRIPPKTTLYWHLALILEAALLGIILYRSPKLRWWESLIGVDFVESLLQLIWYRAGYTWLSRFGWHAGIVLALPLGALALIEAGEQDRGRRQYWHLRILASWLAGRLCILSLQTQPELVLPLNHALLTLDASAFLAWSCLFML